MNIVTEHNWTDTWEFTESDVQRFKKWLIEQRQTHVEVLLEMREQPPGYEGLVPSTLEYERRAMLTLYNDGVYLPYHGMAPATPQFVLRATAHGFVPHTVRYAPLGTETDIQAQPAAVCAGLSLGEIIATPNMSHHHRRLVDAERICVRTPRTEFDFEKLQAHAVPGALFVYAPWSMSVTYTLELDKHKVTLNNPTANL